ncbi:MlaE family ABC transporter permease, partial [Candidatus Omnitrophota bacterium]
ISSLVALSLTRELGPVLTALIVAGRSGASISAEVSSMKVTEQLDALRSLATDPIGYIAVPKFIALVFTLPLLVLYADLVGIFGGYIVGATKFDISLALYFRKTVEALVFKDVFSGLIKAAIFGAIIGLVCVWEGFSSSGGATGVGKAVIKSVVRSFILILTADCLLTALFYFI